MEEMAEAAVEGCRLFPYGGIEIGGILLGEHKSNRVRILAHAPLARGGSAGPRFVLTPGDEMALERLLDNYRNETALRSLVPVGWYHSHTRTGIFLSPEDVQTFSRFFPQPWQVSLVLHPEEGKPTMAGFFVREGEELQTAGSHREFEAGAVISPPAPPKGEIEPPESALEQPPSPPVALLDPPRPHRFPWRWVLAATSLVLLAGIGVSTLLWLGVRGSARAASSVGLRLSESNGSLKVQWDPASPAILEAASGSVEVVDGDARVVFPFDKQLLRLGSWSMIRLSPDVRVRLRVQGARGEPLEEFARYAGPSEERAMDPAAAEAMIQSEQARLDLLQARTDLQKLQEENTRLADRFAILLDRAKVAATVKPPALPKPEPKAFTPPKPTATMTASLPAAPPVSIPAQAVVTQSSPPPAGTQQAQPPPPPPPQETAQAVRPPETFPVKPLPVTQPPVALPKPAAPAAALAEPPKTTPAYQGPRSGRIIWTGVLPKNAVLTIEGRRASSGSVNAQLPGVPVRVGAFPAELSGGGFTVFSQNPKHANVAEPPGPQNGWNRTVYRSDARRAAEVTVVAAPEAGSGWTRVLVRAERQLSALIIEWEIAER